MAQSVEPGRFSQDRTGPRLPTEVTLLSTSFRRTPKPLLTGALRGSRRTDAGYRTLVRFDLFARAVAKVGNESPLQRRPQSQVLSLVGVVVWSF
jgi:hypothetical protein